MKRIFNININSVIVLKLFSKIIFGICFLSALANAEGAAAPVSNFSQISGYLKNAEVEIVNSINNCILAAGGSDFAICRSTYAPAKAALSKLSASVSAYAAPQGTCLSSAENAGTLCPMTTSPAVKAVNTFLGVGKKILDKTKSASATCDKSSDIFSLANAGMGAAGAACSAVKLTCDTTCGTSATQLAAMIPEVKTIFTGAPTAANQMSTLISNEQGPVIGARVIQCAKYAVDVAGMAEQALGLFANAGEADKCKEQAAGPDSDGSDGGPDVDGGGGGGEFESAELEMCKDPTIAALPVCKCKTDSKAEGCADIIAKNSNAIKSLGPGSQLAGIGGGMKQKGGSSVGIPAASTDAKSEIAKPTTGTDTGTAAAANSGSGSGTHGSGFTSDAPVVGSDSEKMNNGRGGGFASMGGDGGFSGGSKKSGSASEKQIAEAKRKMASEELAKLVSPASGKTNWDKVTTRYDEIDSSFMGK